MASAVVQALKNCGAELTRDFAPNAVGDVCLAPGERNDADGWQLLRPWQVFEDGGTELRPRAD